MIIIEESVSIRSELMMDRDFFCSWILHVTGQIFGTFYQELLGKTSLNLQSLV